MATKNVLIIGANRGIGLNLAKAFVSLSWEVTASIRPQTRDDPSVAELKDTGATVVEIDYLDDGTIEKAAEAYGDKPLDILINVGCKLHPQLATFRLIRTSQVSPHILCRGMNSLLSSWLRDFESWLWQGPFLTMKHFLPKLEKASQPKIVNISSIFGSISGKYFIVLSS
ncbi:hypothetical protein FAGAP_12686 [Fusarium agapanthi]|uniref:Uncharacterized protein n=1 Tax=Fusarium agapanthi TaxID=1803897 RepID=A0A9P5E7L3_9HYPO|nr:hypothetical protein FAGAP_12686 [Fusarium agapanthi]